MDDRTARCTGVASSVLFALLVGHYVLRLPGFAPFIELQHPIPAQELREPEGGPRYQRM